MGAPVDGRSRLRRVLRVAVALTVALALAAVVGLVCLHTAPVLAVARALAERWGGAAAGGTLRLGRLELALWKGQVAATAVTLEQPGVSISAQRVEVDWSPSGARVSLLRPRVVLTETAGEKPPPRPATGLAAQPWRVVERVAAADIVDGRLELRDATGAAWLVLEQIGLALPSRDGPASLRVESAAFGWPEGGLRVKPASAHAQLRVEKGALVVASGTIVSGTATLDLAGRLERVLPMTATAMARGAFDESLLEALAPGSGIRGRVEATAAIHVADDRLTGTLDAASAALTAGGLGPWSVTGRGRFEGARLVLDPLAAQGYGGRLEVAGPLALLPTAQTELRLTARGLDPARLARALTGKAPPLSARASGELRFTGRGWDVAQGQGDGRLELAPASGPGLKPAAAATLRVRGRDVAIADARVAVHAARASGEARLTARGALGGRVRVELPVAALEPLAADLGQTIEAPALDGRLVADAELGGTTAAPELKLRVRGDALAFEGRELGLAAEAGYAAGRLSVSPLVLRSGRGQATLSGRLPLAAADAWDLAGEVDAFDLAPALAMAGLDASAPATGSLRVSGPRDEPVAGVSLRAEARLARAEGGAPGTEPDVRLELEARSTGARVALERLDAQVAGGRVSGSGGYDAATGAAAGSFELSALAWERLPLLPPAARRVTGTFGGRLTLGGTTAAPSGELQLALAEPRLDGAPLPPIALAARSDGRELRVTGTWGPAELLKGTGRLEADWPLRLVLDAKALPYGALVAAFPALVEARVQAEGTGSVSFDLPLRDPAALRYATSDLAFSGRVRRLEWRTAPFSLSGNRQSLEVDRLKLEAGAAWLAVRGRAGLAGSSPFDLDVEGNLDFAALGPALPARALDGDGTLKLHVAGTADAPQLDGTLRLVDVRGRYEGAGVQDLDAEARFSGRELRIDSLHARVLGGTASASGGLVLFGSGGAPPRFTFEVQDLDLARLLDRELRDAASSPSLLVSLDGELTAARPALDSVSARGRLTRLDSRTEEGVLALAAPAAWSFERGVLAAEPVRLAGPLGALEARLARSADTAGAGYEAAVSGAFDLRAISPFLPGTSLSGPATIDVRARRGPAGPRLDGSIRVEKGRLALDDLNFVASGLEGVLRFAGDRVELAATAASGDGSLRAEGGMRLGPSLLGPADVALTAERIPLNYPVGLRGRASGRLRLSGEPGQYRLAGDVEVRQAWFTADFDAESQSLDRLDWQLAALEGGSLTDQIALDVNARLVEPLRIRNSTMRLDVEGTVVAAGTLAQPVSEGVVTLREGGELTLGRARVRVSGGRVALNGYPAGTPDVELQGATSVSGIAVRLQARGTLDDVQLTLDSDRGDLSQSDLVSLLLTGRTASAAASQGGVVVAEQLAVALGGALQKGVGDTLLIDVAPDRSLLNEDVDPTQRLHIGARITQNTSVLYSTALDGTEQRWTVELNPGGGRFRLRAIMEEDNALSFEGTDRLSFDLWNRGSGGSKAPREVERLASLSFAGALPLPEPELRQAAKLKAGRRYSGLQREQAADRVRERLARAGYRAASVEALSTPAAHGVSLVLRVDAGPQVAFSWSGDDPGKKTREAAEKAFTAFTAPEAAAAQVARVALQRLQADGYYGASVEPRAEASEGRIEVGLGVARGVRGSRIVVEFDGNQALGDAELLAVLPKPGSRAFFEALDPRHARVSSSVRLAYAGIGYLRARVLPARTRFDAGSGVLTVTIGVRERAASTVARIDLPAELSGARGPGPELKLRAGEPFDLSAYVADRDALSAWYRSRGWLEAQATASMEARGGSVTVTYEVDPGPRARVGSVRVVDASGTRSSLIRRAITLDEGDLVTPQALADTRERLSDIGVYRSVDVRAEPRPGGELRDVVVGLVPRSDVTVEYGLRYTTAGKSSTPEGAPTAPSDERLQAAVAAEVANPFGYGVKARGYSFLTKSRATWGVSLDAATFVGRRLRTQLFVYDDDADDDFLLAGIDSQVRGVTLQQSRVLLRERRSRRWHDRLRLQWGYTFKDIRYFGSESDEVLLQGDRGFLSLAAIGDERDSLTDPSRGVFWTLSSELARPKLGSDVSYVRLYGQVFAYLPIGPLVWAQGVRVGSVPGEDPLLLIENRFRAGGSTTVRGFDQNALGPRSADGGSLGGQAVVVVNQELRFPIYKDLKGGLFWDAGNVWAFSRELGFKDLRSSWGLGLRYMFPFGPLRLEYAWVIGPEPGEPKGRVVFGLGHAF